MDNKQAPKRRQRSKAEPATTPEFTPVNKYAPKAKIGKPTLGLIFFVQPDMPLPTKNEHFVQPEAFRATKNEILL